MAYKVFSNGDALTGSELNTYLMNQSVMVFASTTARDAALTAPTEGMVVWLQDANKYVYYTGSAWADLITPASSGNVILNSAFDIWQRGTSTTSTGYLADRWSYDTAGGDTRTQSQQTFTPGSAPVAGYESAYFYRVAITVASGYQQLQTKIEDVRTLAGQTVTISYWAKAAAAGEIIGALFLDQSFGTGGSSTVNNTVTANHVPLTTSWVRYTHTITLPSIAGKTVGTGSSLNVRFTVDGTGTLDIWGVQLEAGSTATAFKRNASNIQGELAACQRYYEKTYNITDIGGTANGTGAAGSPVMAPNGTSGYRSLYTTFKVSKRANPTVSLWDITGNSGKATTYSSVDLSQTHNITITADQIGNSGFRTYLQTGNGGYAFHFVAESEL